MDLTKCKELFGRLGCPYAPVAVKYTFYRPENIPPFEGQRSLCSFIRLAQEQDRAFYITEENECCVGRFVLGMTDIPPFEGSGSVGPQLGVYCTPAANARLYHSIPTLTKGAHPYVIFSPLDKCGFDPDLVILVCRQEQLDIIIRANSWFTGDLWESRDTVVLGCSWMLAYPYISGKINSAVTGTHMGQKTLRPYPEGLHMISIPFQKLREITAALEELPWEIPQPEGSPEEIERMKAATHQTFRHNPIDNL